MKYILFIMLVVTTSCNKKSSNAETNNYTFDNHQSQIEKYEIDTAALKNESISIQQTTSKNTDDLSLKRDSKMKIFSLNAQNRKKLNEFYKTANFKPSEKYNHLEHIRKYSSIGQIDGKSHNPKLFVDYIIENNLEKPQHKKYITDRKLLRKLQNKVCWDNYVSIIDTLQNGDKIEIELKSQDFDTVNRTLKYQFKSNFLIEIDGKYPFGSVYSKTPNKEIKSLSIKINSKQLQTSLSNYQNLYEPVFCNFGGYQRITEAYEDGENIYIYIFGGIAADSYFAKIIFDKSSGYITSIIADYGPLSQYGSFGEHFIGF